MLVNLNLQRLSIPELTELVRMHLNSVRDSDLEIHDAIVSKYLKTLEKAADNLEIAAKASHGNANNKLIYEADKVRDRALSVFRRLMQVYELSDDKSPEAQAYEVLNDMWKKYDSLQYMSLMVETEGIDNLLFDLSTSRYAPHIQVLNLDDAVQKIRASNDAFKEVYEQYHKEPVNNAAAVPTYDARELRIGLVETVRLYSEYVYALAKSAENKEMRALLNMLNETRNVFVHRLTARHAGEGALEEI